MTGLGQMLNGVLRDAQTARQKAGDAPAAVSFPAPWPKANEWGDRHIVVEPTEEPKGRPICRARRAPGFDRCPHCAGMGHTWEWRDRYEFAVACTCAALDARIAAFNAAQIPAKLASVSAYSTDWNKVGKAAGAPVGSMRRSWRPGSRSLLLYGPNGSGKTHLAAVTARSVALRYGANVHWLRWDLFVKDLLACRRDEGARAKLLDPVYVTHLLIVDELGGGMQGDWVSQLVEETVSWRLEHGRTVVATTNLGIDEDGSAVAPQPSPGLSLRTCIGDRAYSRLRGAADMVVCGAADQRLVDHDAVDE